MVTPAINGTYNPSSVSVLPGADFMSYSQTTWSAAEGNASSVNGHNFFWVRNYDVISNLAPEYQLGSEIDGYDLVYSCYDTPNANNHHIYFLLLQSF